MKKLVLVEWVDSSMRADWNTDAPRDEVLTCFSVGWLAHKGKNSLTLIPNWTEELTAQHCADMTIPTRAVKKIIKLGKK
jgi:hypothetical protein